MFFEQTCDCRNQIGAALRRIRDSGVGLLIYLRQEGMGLGFSAVLSHDDRDWRRYEIAIAILKHYGIRSVQLISLNHEKFRALEAASIRATCSPWHEGKTILLSERLDRVLKHISEHNIPGPIRADSGHPRILVAGDLNVDHVQTAVQPSVAGSGFNAAVEFRKANLCPILFGKVGQDSDGQVIRNTIAEHGLYALIGVHRTKKSGSVRVTFTFDSNSPFHYEWEKTNNANDYDVAALRQAIKIAAVEADDYIFISSYLFVQHRFSHSTIRGFLEAASTTRAKVILDLVRKSFSQEVLRECEATAFGAEDLKACIRGTTLYAVVGEISTFNRFGFCKGHGFPDKEVLGALIDYFEARWIICRYVDANEFHQRIACLSGAEVVIVSDEKEEAEMRIGLHRVGR
jgi:hypothetical protein